jgi:hypothetical protein
MRKWLGLLLSTVVALAVVLGTLVANVTASASPSQTYSGPYFGDGNLPPGCIRSMSPDNPENQCFHMRTGLNALDAPKVDVLILVPVSPFAERDMRIMRQAVEMWEGGIDYLAEEMKLPWLTTVDFRITVDAVGNVDTYPVVDPEIVIIASNPVGGIGIGIDPTQFLNELEIYDTDGVPCHGITNPFDFGTWQGMPGFDQHHGKDEGVYVEDCGGAGGNVCFAVNGAIDPVPGVTDVFGIFDLITHEFGHCLTLGHVGDGAEGSWGVVPTNDIMSYSEDPPGRSKCVSTLDVEAFAVRMSGYLDRNGDGTVSALDLLTVNDVPGDGRNPFQVQSPTDHLYASDTGRPMDCPQPDLGLTPGTPTDWTPTPVASSKPQLTLGTAKNKRGKLRLAGTVGYVPTGAQPTKSTASFEDRSGDSTSPFNDVRSLTVSVTDSSVDAFVTLGQLWPTTQATSVGGYSVVINGHRFDSFIPAGESEVMTWDNGREVYLPGSSSWDAASNTVRFHLSRAYLAKFGITAPYHVGSQANVQNGKRFVFIDDRAPEGEGTIGVTGKPLTPVKESSAAFDPPMGAQPYTVEFKSSGGNTYAVTSSNLGETLVADNTQFAMAVRSPSKVEVVLDWDDDASDLDLSVGQQGGDAVSGDGGSLPEKVVLDQVQGLLDLTVKPFLVSPSGTTYSLKATVTPLGGDSDRDGVTDPGDQCKKKKGPAPTGCPDADLDGVPDKFDKCKKRPGVGTANGCPVPATEWVKVFVDGKLAKQQRVDRAFGTGAFALKLAAGRGKHKVRIIWVDRSGVLASVTRKVR